MHLHDQSTRTGLLCEVPGMKLHTPVINPPNSRLFVEHDYACPVCHEEHAVYQLYGGAFQPCWNCQRRGWSVVRKKRRWWHRRKKPDAGKVTRRTNIPDPDCPRCDGVGWFEGGKALQTSCSCLKNVSKSEALDSVTNGDIESWRRLYASTQQTTGTEKEVGGG